MGRCRNPSFHVITRVKPMLADSKLLRINRRNENVGS